MSNDPVGFATDKPMMFNRYAYEGNNPYKYVDPDGKEVAYANDFEAIVFEIAFDMVSEVSSELKEKVGAIRDPKSEIRKSS